MMNAEFRSKEIQRLSSDYVLYYRSETELRIVRQRHSFFVHNIFSMEP
jgi:hypothetical protein